MPSIADRLATTIAAHTSDVFGLMGNGNAYLIDAFRRLTDVRFTAVRHETATVASADAYHRVSRRLAVATTTYGAGFTNALTSLTEAAMARTPVLVVVGDAPTSGARPWDVEQSALGTTVGVRSVVVTAAAPGRAALDAIRYALEHRTPVLLELPYDLPALDAPDEDLDLTERPARAPVAIDVERTDDAARALLSARRPLVLAGRGARGAAAELVALADRLGAASVSTAPARGTFGNRALDLGVCGGFASERTLARTRAADVVLVVGAGLNQFTTAFGTAFAPDARVIRIDDDAPAPNPIVTDEITGDARLAVERILAVIGDAGVGQAHVAADGAVPAAAVDDTAPGTRLDREQGEERAADGRLDPRSLSIALDALLPTDRLVVSDGGHFIGWANMYFRLPSPDSITLVGTAFQSIGLGFASAPGAAAAAPERTLVVVTGDGGGLMALADLDSVVRSARSAVVVVFNDAAYTAEVTQYGTLGLDEGPMRIDEVDFAAIGRGVGAEGAVVRSLDDLDALRAWQDAGARGTFVLDCRVSGAVIAPYQREIMERLHAAARRID
ncbi:thiamine pyrophosphate-binding protein [Pseudoclavibacter chungangensis]|uniref:Thiamine pyrophosphate-binding protein n=1 Tax=Pseudoclavibacter chungangensis TaxID=587635 RepID=A0A7J5BZJ9_9MICO|nr:thiamine pyrophosphate-binding protein [Pseudoclavibacter chungangensis]KAB1659575.1 thiamine pyrophosphate-binding protein [Pseudoclavibacter chungangensis]NYJ67397.1 thiamine pyrophosphate-dependent acetolactate synthase large subunit-like protein [Pseudoclavibacter chungangensis]